MSQFTTPTTCYSGARKPASPLRLATENHVLGVVLLDSDDNSKIETSCDAVPRDNASVMCVGFSQFGPLQALALVDPACIEQPEQQEHTPMLYEPTTAQDDAFSVFSTAYSVSAPDSSTSTIRGGHRRAPSGNVSLAPTTATTASIHTPSSATTTTTNTAPTNTHGKLSDASSSHTDHPKDSDVPEVSSTVQPPKARLILQTPENEYFTFLDFRPLCPCVAQWGDNNKNIGIWVGSAEDAQLRCYEPNPSDRRLRPRALPEDYFRVNTPVMGLDFHTSATTTTTTTTTTGDCTQTHTHTLAVACQDGTIQLLTWKGDFEELTNHEVIVDGPLVSLHLQEHPGGSLRVVVGSLCGYVCQLVRQQATSTSSMCWEAPTMIVQGLWNEAIATEDSVLSVYALDDCIAIGTHAGRCILYKYCHLDGKHYILWECLLPYSVHGLVMTKQSSPPLRLVVTTRRSLHVFQPPKGVVDAVETISPQMAYSSDLAKQRLSELLQDFAKQRLLALFQAPPTIRSEEEKEAPEVTLVESRSSETKESSTLEVSSDEEESGTNQEEAQAQPHDLAGTSIERILPVLVLEPPEVVIVATKLESKEEVAQPHDLAGTCIIENIPLLEPSPEVVTAAKEPETKEEDEEEDAPSDEAESKTDSEDNWILLEPPTEVAQDTDGSQPPNAE
jgi:hypothetical protein